MKIDVKPSLRFALTTMAREELPMSIFYFNQ
jgi:hypothetical protein